MTSFMIVQGKEGFYVAGLLSLIRGGPSSGEGHVFGLVLPMIRFAERGKGV